MRTPVANRARIGFEPLAGRFGRKYLQFQKATVASELSRGAPLTCGGPDMGAKTWMLVGASGNARDALAAKPRLDREATVRLAERLFAKDQLEALDDGNLSYTCPPDDEIHIGCFSGVAVVAAKEFGIDYPSRLESRFLNEMRARTVYLHAMHSVVDWFAYAVWNDGNKLRRSLSLSPESGVIEDIGPRLP